MSKKRKRAHPVQPAKPKDAVVWRQSAEEATLAAKPRYNGFACGHGAHGPAKYSRARAKQAWKRQMRQEGAPRGSFPLEGLPAMGSWGASATGVKRLGVVTPFCACQIAERAASSPCPPCLRH